MKHVYKTAIALALAACLGLSYSSVAVSADVDNTGGNTGPNQPADADLDRIQPDEPDQDRDQSDDPDQDQIQDGDQTATGNEGTEDMYEYQHMYEESHAKQGLAVDQMLAPRETQTHFRARLHTVSDVLENGMITLHQGDLVKLESEMNVDPGDIGQTAECLVVAEYQTQENAESRVFMLAENGWEEWDGHFDNLSGKSCQLGQLHQIQAHEGMMIPGVYKLHFGYHLANGGIVASPVPVSFTVNK